MTKYKNKFGEVTDLFNTPSLLEYEEDSESLEWYSIEGSDRIYELSRQLRTFLNYKSVVIRFRFSGSQKEENNPNKGQIIKYEDALFSLYLRYATLLKRIGVEKGTIAEKIRILIEKVKTQPNDLDINLLKEIKHLGGELWKNLHILSEFKFHYHPRLLHMAIKIACVLSSVEGVYFLYFSDFYSELKWSYLQLEKELSALLCSNEDEQFEIKKKKRQVRILE